jgi:hypothetical protein
VVKVAETKKNKGKLILEDEDVRIEFEKINYNSDKNKQLIDFIFKNWYKFVNTDKIFSDIYYLKDGVYINKTGKRSTKYKLSLDKHHGIPIGTVAYKKIDEEGNYVFEFIGENTFRNKNFYFKIIKLY